MSNEKYLIGGFITGAVLFAAWLEYLVRLRESSPDDYRRLVLFRDAFLGWLPGFKNTDKRKTRNRVQT